MLTPDEIGHSADRIQKLGLQYQKQVMNAIPEFFEFLKKPDVSKKDLRKTKKQFRQYIAKITSNMSVRTNEIVNDTMRDLARKSVKETRDSVKAAARAGAKIGGGDG